MNNVQPNATALMHSTLVLQARSSAHKPIWRLPCLYAQHSHTYHHYEHSTNVQQQVGPSHLSSILVQDCFWLSHMSWKSSLTQHRNAMSAKTFCAKEDDVLVSIPKSYMPQKDRQRCCVT